MKTWKIRAKVVVAFVLASLGAPSYAAILWGMELDNDNLLTVNIVTGSVTIVGDLPGSSSFGGLDFDSSGNLYVLKSDQGLYRVNPADATGVLVGTQSGRTLESFEIIGNKGYAADVFNESLYEIDLTTGAATLLGSHNISVLDERVTGLASNSGVLFGTRIFQNDIVRLNTLTGAVDVVVGVHGLNSLTSLAFADGLLWGIPVGQNDLYSINPTTGAATLVNGNLLNVPHITGLTALEVSIPEPATLALFGLGLAGIGAIRRKKLAT